jgi:3-hydroxyacyl-[acyl-carrier-protein] dehydratase
MNDQIISDHPLHPYLPHRQDMLLLDTCQKVGEQAHATYTVKGQEFFLRGHFPGNPVVPGVILCEMMAQSCCVLIGTSIGNPYFTGIKEAKFRGIV